MKLVLPSFRAAGALLSDKIDSLVRAIAAVVNGNLDVKNLAPGLTFGAASFNETRALFAMRAVLNPATRYATFGVCKVACRLVGWGGTLDDSAGTIQALTWIVKANGVDLKSIYVPHEATPANPQQAMLAVPLDVAAGTLLTADVSLAGYCGQLTLFFDAPHVV